MTWVTPPQRLDPRRIEEVESGAEAVYAEIREAEEAADRRHDFSDHLGPYGRRVGALPLQPWILDVTDDGPEAKR